jgi:ribonuclease P protein component
MIWKPYRLRKNWQFQGIIKSGQRLVNSSFVIFSAENNLNNCLFGISVPQKLVKKAVDRNYYKRQTRNMIILFLKKNNDNCRIGSAHQHRSLVIIVRHFYLTNNFATNQRNLYKLWSLTFERRTDINNI